MEIQIRFSGSEPETSGPAEVVEERRWETVLEEIPRRRVAARRHTFNVYEKEKKKQRPLVTSSLNIYPNEEDGGRRRGRIPSGHLSRHGDKASAAVGARPAKSRDPLRLYVPITAHHMKSAPSIIIPAGRHQSCLRRAPTRGGAVISGLD